jgi:hypothetical protein
MISHRARLAGTSFFKEAGCGARRHSTGDEASPLWEWLPATIIAAGCRSHREKINFIGTY